MPDPFITTEDLAAFLGVDESELSEFADFALDAACEVVRGATGMLINGVEDEEITLDGSGRQMLLLPERPVTEISEITIAGVDDPLTPDEDYRLDSDPLAGIVYATNGFWPDGLWPYGRQNITVTYSHGYGYEDDIPSDIRLVALAVARRVYLSTGTLTVASGQISEVSLGAARVVLENTSTAVLGAALEAGEVASLSRYRALRVA